MRAFSPDVVGCDLAEFDIADERSALEAIRRLGPRLIVNCAAATDVDRCELDHDYADNANLIGPANVARAAAEVGARMIHISTDFVFDGSKGGSYREDESPRPLSYYGLSKLRGEEAVMAALPNAIVVRTSWLYGGGEAHFPAKVLQWAASAREIRVVNDQFGSPTYAEDLADALLSFSATDASGIYHLGGSGCVSRYEWAREIMALAGAEVTVLPAATSDFPLPAARPACSCLDCSKAAALGVVLPPWRDGLARYVHSRLGAC
jgi:dTDP-4-dehydrorhamnose reductase